MVLKNQKQNKSDIHVINVMNGKWKNKNTANNR